MVHSNHVLTVKGVYRMPCSALSFSNNGWRRAVRIQFAQLEEKCFQLQQVTGILQAQKQGLDEKKGLLFPS